MGKHEAPGRATRKVEILQYGQFIEYGRKTAKHVLHPVVHVVGTVLIDAAALTILHYTPILHVIGIEG